MRQMWLLVVLSTVASLSSAAIWSNSNPRGELLSQLAEAGFAQQEQLLQMGIQTAFIEVMIDELALANPPDVQGNWQAQSADIALQIMRLARQVNLLQQTEQALLKQENQVTPKIFKLIKQTPPKRLEQSGYSLYEIEYLNQQNHKALLELEIGIDTLIEHFIQLPIIENELGK